MMVRSGVMAVCTTVLSTLSVPLRAETEAEPASDTARPPLRFHGGDEGVAPKADVPPRRESLERPVDRPFLYLVDPRLPPLLGAVAGSGASYTSTEAAARPLAANANRSGFVGDLRLELGLHARLSAFATGRFAPASTEGAKSRGSFDAGIRVLVTPPESSNLRVALDGGVLRDFMDGAGGFSRATATFDVGRLRLGALAHAERVFGIGRDDIDVYTVVGAAVRVVDRMRLGAEYVAQDLEEIGEPAAEGGARQFAGGSVSWSSERVSIAAGPAFGLGGGAPSLLGRAQINVSF